MNKIHWAIVIFISVAYILSIACAYNLGYMQAQLEHIEKIVDQSSQKLDKARELMDEDKKD